MFDTSKIRKLDEYRYLIPKEARSDMRTNAVVYANEKLLAAILKDLSLEQAVNVATLPGIVGDSLAMPDIHQGYGFPIGGVAATDYKTGVVSPGGVGFDINCGVRLLASPLTRAEVAPRIRDLVNQLFRDVPCGTGKESQLLLTHADLDHVLATGVQWMVEHDFGQPTDMEFCEEHGQLRGADRGPWPLRGSDCCSHSYRLARPGPSGLHRLSCADGRGHEEVLHHPARPSACLRAHPVAGRPGVSRRHVRRSQLRLG
jgi:RNA-splicing ligase RtcB